jgi:hypothetical protein
MCNLIPEHYTSTSSSFLFNILFIYIKIPALTPVGTRCSANCAAMMRSDCKYKHASNIHNKLEKIDHSGCPSSNLPSNRIPSTQDPTKNNKSPKSSKVSGLCTVAALENHGRLRFPERAMVALRMYKWTDKKLAMSSMGRIVVVVDDDSSPKVVDDDDDE